MMCSGWLKLDSGGRQPCLKEVNEGSLHLTWESQLGRHDLRFCSWKCLKGFIENSVWLMLEESK